MPVTDLTGTTWVFNDTINYSEFNTTVGTSVQLDFISNNGNYTAMTTDFKPNGFKYVTGAGFNQLVYANSEGWANEAYKTINITGGEGATRATLISWLESNATQQALSTKVTVDLTTLPGWASLSTGSHNITVVAKADGYSDSEPSAAVSVEKAAAMPVKGDIITMDSKQYRVLKVNGSVAEVLCMYDANSSIKFDSASSGYNNTYAGKNIDTYCNNTFYNSLSTAMKSAIVDKTFTQDSWTFASSAPTQSHYTGKYRSSTYYLTLANAAFGTSITRHCYCLSVQDVLDYLEATTSMGTSDTTLTDTNIWKMFWDGTSSQSGKYIWLRSAGSSSSDIVFYVNGSVGYLATDAVNSTNAARPAFQIDLSKISWSK